MKKTIIALAVAALAAVGLVFALNSANATPGAGALKAATSTSNNCTGSSKYVPCVNTTTTITGPAAVKKNKSTAIVGTVTAGTAKPVGTVALSCTGAGSGSATLTGASTAFSISIAFPNSSYTSTCTATFTGAAGSLWNSSTGTLAVVVNNTGT